MTKGCHWRRIKGNGHARNVGNLLPGSVRGHHGVNRSRSPNPGTAINYGSMAEKPDSSKLARAAALAVAPDHSVEFVLSRAVTPEKFCAALSKLFAVRVNEVALLRLEKGLLRFIFPEQLQTAGSIPVSSSSSVAADTATTKKTLLFNAFTTVKHARVFETIKLEGGEETDPSEQASIQKLMSAPVLGSDQKVLGVIQVSRKAFDATSAGPDFTREDLQQLEVAARVAAKLPFMQSSFTA